MGLLRDCLGVTWETEQFDKHHRPNMLFINTNYIPSIQSDKM